MDADVANAIEVLQKHGAVFLFPKDLKARALTVAQLSERIQFGRTWILQHLEEFPNVWRAPGGGSNGGELRFPVRDVEAFEERRRVFSA